MVILQHPVAAHVVLVTTSDAENLSFVGNKGSAEFWNNELVIEANFLARVLIHIVEVNILGSPFEVVDKLAGAVALLENEGVMEQLRKLAEHVDVRVVCNAAGELSHLTLLGDKLLGNSVQISSDSLKAVEI